ncbi:MAG: hypothetical protein EU547_03820 [Promethearchaeota archaeon]|nr:MAG: hypothetical protein EU547_03820 [Candidatus Lokiarchaeota archaeon]
MTFSDFTPFQVLQGVLGLIWVLIAIIVGIRILLKARELTRKDLIGVGLTYILVSSAWWGVVIQFIYYGIFPNPLPPALYLLIANMFIPIGLFFWMYSFSETIIPFNKKIILIITAIFVIIWEIILFIFIFSDNIALVGTINEINPLDSSHGDVMRYFIIAAIIIFVGTGCYFSYKSITLEQIEIKWKGRFLLLAWISFAIGAIMDAIIPTHTELTLILTRIILISSAFEYYLGFFLPAKLKEILLK